jgi:hypothetical protein
MDGYEVYGSDDGKVGQVVGLEGDLLIVEGGLLRKSRHAVPKAFAHTDDGEQVVRLSVSKDLVYDSPALGDEVDQDAVAEHYGLVGHTAAPETLGYGDVLPGDPALGAEALGADEGVEPAVEQRARMREGHDKPGLRGRQIIPPDAHDKV